MHDTPFPTAAELVMLQLLAPPVCPQRHNEDADTTQAAQDCADNSLTADEASVWGPRLPPQHIHLQSTHVQHTGQHKDGRRASK
jgi:hypothetical protein